MSEKKITAKEFVDYILQHMDARTALEKLMASQLTHYEKLKLEKQPEDNAESVSPYFIMCAAAMDLGWMIAIEGEEKSTIIRGLSVGTQEYMDDLFKPKPKDDGTEHDGSGSPKVDEAS